MVAFPSSVLAFDLCDLVNGGVIIYPLFSFITITKQPLCQQKRSKWF